jgi:hypothetical protein
MVFSFSIFAGRATGSGESKERRGFSRLPGASALFFERLENPNQILFGAISQTEIPADGSSEGSHQPKDAL